VFRSAEGGGYPIVVPWGLFGIVLIAAPTVAAAFAAVASRQPRAAQLLRPIE
jgi:hypothetical protein